MSELSLNEGQEFYAGSKRFVISGGVPVQEEKRGPLGGELVEFEQVKVGDCFYAKFIKDNSDYGLMSVSSRFNFHKCDPVEINVPQQAKGRVMTAGEAARLPDIVGKNILINGSVVKTEWGSRSLIVSPKSTASPQIEWRVSDRIILEVLD